MLESIPSQLVVFAVSMLPIFELRGGIPLGLVYGLSSSTALLWSVAGNALAVVILVCLLGPVSDFLSRHSYFFNRFFAWLFERTRRKHGEKFEFWGNLALVLFVAIPLPMTGGWTGAVAAFVFGIEPKKSIPLILTGVLIAGLIVSSVGIGILSI